MTDHAAAELLETVTAFGGLTFTIPRHDTAVGACLRDDGEFARAELDLIETLCDGGLIDVGANIGAICVPFAARHPDLAVTAVEAHPVLAELLQRNVDANGLQNVRVIGAVAGEASGRVDIPVSGLDVPSNMGASSLYAKGLPTAASRMVRLDDLCRDARFVKIDVEGFEPRVLQGATTLLRDLRPSWLVEVSKERPKTAAAVREILFGAGYRLWWFFSPHVARAESGWYRGDWSILASDVGPPAAWDLAEVAREWPDRTRELRYLRRYRRP